MNTFLKKLLGLSLIIACLAFFHSCALGRVIKYSAYKCKIGEQLPDSFRMELPFQVGSDFCFIVRGQLNGQYDMDFIMDTQADNLVKSEDLKRLNATFWMRNGLSAYDIYKHKVKDSLYYFDDFTLGSLSFGHVIFHEVKPNTYIYDILSRAGKNVLGREVFHLLNWKFDVDEEKLTLFRQKKGNSLLTQESEGGYLKIKKGLGRRKKNTVTFSGMNLSGKFILDMGADSELGIGKKLFRKLSKKVPYKRIDGVNSNGSLYLFEDMDVEWNGLVIRHCHLNYVKGRFVDNFIGGGLLSRFNFILAYKLSSGDILTQKDLYLKPRKDFSSIRYTPLISPFGFIVSKGNIGVEAGGLADKTGIRPGDRLVSIDHGAFTTTDYRELNRYLRDKERIEIEVERGKERISFRLSVEK